MPGTSAVLADDRYHSFGLITHALYVELDARVALYRRAFVFLRSIRSYEGEFFLLAHGGIYPH